MIKTIFFAYLVLVLLPLLPNADYVLYEGYDSPGGDIYTVGGLTVKGMHAYCDNLNNCVGFYTDGTFKSSVQPPSQLVKRAGKPLQGLYRKVSNYVFTQGANSPGGDIFTLSGQSAAQLKVACDDNPSCIGFNTNGDLKSSLQSKSKWTQDFTGPKQGLYLKPDAQIPADAPVAPPTPHYKYTDYPTYLASGYSSGDNFATEAQAKEECDKVNYCNAIQKNPNGYLLLIAIEPPRLWMQAGDSYGTYIKNLIPEQGVTLSLPLPNQGVVPESDQGDYQFFQMVKIWGDFLIQLYGLTPVQLRAYCDSHPECVGFTTFGDVFKRVNPQTGWYKFLNFEADMGSYVKKQYIT